MFELFVFKYNLFCNYFLFILVSYLPLILLIYYMFEPIFGGPFWKPKLQLQQPRDVPSAWSSFNHAKLCYFCFNSFTTCIQDGTPAGYTCRATRFDPMHAVVEPQADSFTNGSPRQFCSHDKCHKWMAGSLNQQPCVLPLMLQLCRVAPGCDYKGKCINSSHNPSVDYFSVGTHWNSGREGCEHFVERGHIKA